MPKFIPRKRIQKICDEDFMEHVVGLRQRRKAKVLRTLKIIMQVIAGAAVLMAGFVVTDALLRISEAPLTEEFAVTRPAEETTAEQMTRPEPEGPPMRSFYVPLNMLDNREQAKELMALAQETRTNTAVMLFKDSGGYLSYRSNLMQMRLIKASQKTRYRTDWTLRDLKRAEQRIIAAIHCFDDPLAAGAMTEGAVLLRDTTSVPWKDAQGRRWLNPWSEPAREYLLAVVREVIAFGADDILLAGVGFPGGNLNAAVFPGQEKPEDLEARNAVLREFIQDVKNAAGEDATLYVMIPSAAAVSGAAELGGDLWDCAADWIAIDTRGAPWAADAEYWRARPVIPVVASAEDAQGARDYIVLVDEAQG